MKKLSIPFSKTSFFPGELLNECEDEWQHFFLGTEWEQGEEIVIVTEFDSLRVGEFVDFVHSGRLPSQEELDREDTRRYCH